MIQLILARTVSSLCNCVTYFSGTSRSPGPNFHYRGFNKTRNEQTEYEIDSLLMEDDLVDELVATPLSAEEIAAKLSNSNTKHISNNILVGREVNMDNNNNNNNNGTKGTDIWISGGGSSMGIGGGGGVRTERNENKISNDWWSDGEEDEDDYYSNNNGITGIGGRGIMSGSNQMNEKIINTTFFNTVSEIVNSNNVKNDGIITNNVENDIERDLYFDENIDELSFQGNDSNNNQLQKNNWDKEFLDNYKIDNESFDFIPIKENLDNFSICTDLKTEQIEKNTGQDDEIIFIGQKDHEIYNSNIDSNNNNLDWNYGYNVPRVINNELDNNVSTTINNQGSNLPEKDFGDFGDFGDFTSGNSPNHFVVNTDNINNYQNETRDEYFQSKMRLNLENEDHFDQNTDNVCLKETDNYHNHQINTNQNKTLEVENIMDNFCDFNSPRKEGDNEFIYNSHESSDQISFDGIRDTNNIINTSSSDHPIHSRLDVDSEKQVPEFVHGNLIDDFDDIFNSSCKSNNKFTINNNNTTSDFDYVDNNFQSNHAVSTYEDDEFGMFDFVSAKSPSDNNHINSTLETFKKDHHYNNTQQPFVLLD